MIAEDVRGTAQAFIPDATGRSSWSEQMLTCQAIIATHQAYAKTWCYAVQHMFLEPCEVWHDNCRGSEHFEGELTYITSGVSIGFASAFVHALDTFHQQIQRIARALVTS